MTAQDDGIRVVVMGVSGAGKSTIARLLADALQVGFVDADALHPDSNIARMRAGIPLSDSDRAPWLRAVGVALTEPPDGAVIACSALRRIYRDAIRESAPDAVFVHLNGSPDVLEERIWSRTDHFMPPSMLISQLSTLEPLESDERGGGVDIDASVPAVVDAALAVIRAHSSPAALPATS